MDKSYCELNDYELSMYNVSDKSLWNDIELSRICYTLLNMDV